jgi:hypothetical protein
LDVVAANSKFELATAVHPNSFTLAIVVSGEQTLQATDSRRLHIHHLRLERQSFDVVD